MVESGLDRGLGGVRRRDRRRRRSPSSGTGVGAPEVAPAGGADPVLLGRPRLTGRRIDQIHLHAAALAANLECGVGHAAVIVPSALRPHACDTGRAMSPRIAGLVLAAGRSSRMGRPKALLPDGAGTPFVVRAARTLRVAGAHPVMVVARPETRDAIAAALAELGPDSGVTLLVNEDPDRGQLSSLLTGLEAAGDVDALVVTLVDVPFVTTATVRAVMEAWEQARPPIARPARGDVHGHPVVFDRRTFEALRSAPLEQGAKPVVRGYASAIEHVAVDDDGAFVDLDTPEDYAGARGR